ncbi:MAG: glycoside hydrolase [gamma proteobacterium symbiont of Taylorina sp.]|nr:glycoside hydrolase [gamma proteobacterium symbiont of Taylorina sp.]
MTNKISHFVFYKEHQFYSSFPAVLSLPDKTILLMFRRARDVRWMIDDDSEESQLLKYQVDHIDSRSQLSKIILNQDLEQLSPAKSLSPDPEAADQDASLLLLKDNSILLSSFAWYPLPARIATQLTKNGIGSAGSMSSTGCSYIMWGGFVRKSSDLAKHWSVHQYLPPLPEAAEIIPNQRTSCGGAIRGQAIEVDNEILLPVYIRLKGHKTDGCHLYVSKDNGNSWSYRSAIAIDKNQKIHFNEPSLIQCDNNKTVAFMRSANGEDHLFTAISYDRGHHWEAWQQREVVGHPTHPFRLKDGRILLTYGYRHKPYGIRAQLMDKQAEHFIGDEIIVRDDAVCADIGYPCATQLANGKVLIVYYFTKEDGVRHIAGSVLSV